MSTVTPITFTIPLSGAAHQQAQYLCQQQPNRRKAKQVYLNTLAVYAVQHYCESLGIATDWASSDSADPVSVALADVADLMLPGVGKVECRPVLPAAAQCLLPFAPQPEQIGCVAVQFDPELRQATLLGFVLTWTPPAIALNALQPLSTLLTIVAARLHRINLRDWFQRVATASWQPLEQVIDTMVETLDRTPALAYRSTATALPNTVPGLIELFQVNTDKRLRLQILNLLGCIAVADQTAIAFLSDLVTTTTDDDLRRQMAITLGLLQPEHPHAGVRRARVLELGVQVQQQRLLLVLTLTPQVNAHTEVHVRLYLTTQTLLPVQLHLSILDEFGNTFLEEQTTGTEDWLQLVFSGQQNDLFTLRLQQGAAILTEAFVI